MGKKKLKDAPASVDAVSSESKPDLFSSLFGDVSDTASIFSDQNPFKRNPFQEQPQTLAPAPATPRNGVAEKRKKATESASVKKYRRDQEVAVEVVAKEKKKRKRDEVEKDYEMKKYGAVDGNDGEEKRVSEKVGAKRKTADNPAENLVAKEGFDDEGKLLRTVFVGNLPLKVKKKALIKEFGKFGEVESVRIRSVPLTDTKTPRKGAVLTKQFHESADSVHGYVVFKTEEAAQASLAHNMAVVEDHHIRVDRACPPRKKMKKDETSLYDHKRTVFVGNLPFDVKDEEVYQLFCGITNLGSSIIGVRVIRDPNNNLGKGFAYVLFDTREAAHAVVTKRNLKIRDRELRLFHAKPESTPTKRKNLTPDEKSGSPAKKSRSSGYAEGQKRVFPIASTACYQGVRASKSGADKKVAKASKPETVISKAKKVKVRSEKRPSVAARKAKANLVKERDTGMKRKMESRTPESALGKKKARKVR